METTGLVLCCVRRLATKQLGSCAREVCWRAVLLKHKLVLCFWFIKNMKNAGDRTFIEVYVCQKNFRIGWGFVKDIAKNITVQFFHSHGSNVTLSVMNKVVCVFDRFYCILRYTIRNPTTQYNLSRIAYYSIRRSESYGQADWCHAA